MDPATLSDAIHSSTARSLVAQVRYFSSTPPTWIPGLDTLLDAAPNLHLHRGDLVELQGLPGTAKSSLLLHLAATALLPRTAHVPIADTVLAVPVAGKELHVAWLDCTPARFDLDRLAALVRHHLDLAIRRFRAPRGIGAPRDSELDALVDECMTRLTVFTPTSTLQLAATLRGLPRWASAHTADELGYVLIDGMSEFAWADQHAAATATGGPTAPPVRLVLDALSHLRATLSPLVFLTQWVFRPAAVLAHKSQEGLPFYAHHYPPSHWPSILSPARPPPPPPAPSDPRRPLDPPQASPPGPTASGRPAPPVPVPVPLALHLTLHPSPTPPLRRGTPLALLLSEQRRRVRVREREREGPGAGTARGAVGGTEGIRCVVRRPGGAEVGSWEIEVWEREIVT
ncbi:hypothetical protein DMC30DRAFT_88985 [Rhodotorula diobovata]|uniref:Uncharacterized protein n=1 Tax=Rhodotorula diobovata TaxID=5288 RepID=A0A5C5FNQ4_9BASI|nr:hypothetical protein DMC30DRAFT_88985 [Rhodotorula diobovata]